MTEGSVSASPLRRAAWVALGCLLVGVGMLGAVLPLLPSTIFLVLAAACFARSSPRLHAWLLRLPYAGPLVRDYVAGLGMPLQAKWTAIIMITVATVVSALKFIPTWWGQGLWALVGIAGVLFIALRVPTRR